jgi:CRISPR-associated protein Cmr2
MEAEKKQGAINYFATSCQHIIEKFPWVNQGQDAPASLPWGIPWIAKNHANWFNPRLLNAGWLIDDYHPKNPRTNEIFTRREQQEEKRKVLQLLRDAISKCFTPGKNPTDWYVLAAGDGDSMSEWLKGTKLEAYSHYLPDKLHPKIEKMPDRYREPLTEFLKKKKRMGPSTHSALSRALLDFSNQLVPYLTEERYAGRLIYSGGDDVLAYTNLWEWDSWLWDISQCFKGENDPKNEFVEDGNYWRWDNGKLPESLSPRPLFTLGENATISFGIAIASHSVPLAIALENLWEAETEAKDHNFPKGEPKDAVQVRVLYGNGNILKATAKFKAFQQWRQLVNEGIGESAIFEQAAQLWSQHPAPIEDAIAPWANAFCSRREALRGDDEATFQTNLTNFLRELWQTTAPENLNNEVQNWLKLAAFTLRSQQIDIPLGGEM